MLDKPTEALALFAQALKLTDSAVPQSSASSSGPPRLDVSRDQASTLQTCLGGLVAKYRGLVTLEQLDANSSGQQQRPAVERLHQFNPNADLSNLVPYPPKMQAVPVKPLFLDVAWNYIGYPQNAGSQPQPIADSPAPEEKKGRGWFGFGRS